MQGSTAILGLLAGVLWGSVAAPEDDEALRTCLRECGESADTDAETCRLQCRQRSESTIEHWTREERKGGSPDPNVEGGSTTTTVKRGPQGTTTTVEHTDRWGRTTVTQHAGSEPAEGARGTSVSTAARLQAWCWVGCSTRTSLAARMSCRARCPRPSLQ